MGEASTIINEFTGRGRKRALDLFITALRYSGTLHRLVFSNKNLTLIGCQEDPTSWKALAPLCRTAHIEFNDLYALDPGEFYCFSRTGVDKIKMPMAAALARVAPKAKNIKRSLPATFNQWSRAMREIPMQRLEAFTDPVVHLLGAIAGLSPSQLLSGSTALQDEIEWRR